MRQIQELNLKKISIINNTTNKKSLKKKKKKQGVVLDQTILDYGSKRKNKGHLGGLVG